MPVDRRAGLQFGLLLLAVPAQYLVSHWFNTTESQRSYAIRNIVNSAGAFKDQYFSWKSWKNWCANLISLEYFEDLGDNHGESPSEEVLKHMDQRGYFAGSMEPRVFRPPEVQFRVGQVIKHKLWGYRGIIVGWDEVAKAPAQWIRANHAKGNERWRTQPNYAILVDTRDRLTPQITYVPQENIQVIINQQIIHPSIDHYFEKFDGAQYLPRPWLKAVYPKDS